MGPARVQAQEEVAFNRGKRDLEIPAVAVPPINPQNLDIYINVTITYQLER